MDDDTQDEAAFPVGDALLDNDDEPVTEAEEFDEGWRAGRVHGPPLPHVFPDGTDDICPRDAGSLRWLVLQMEVRYHWRRILLNLGIGAAIGWLGWSLRDSEWGYFLMFVSFVVIASYLGTWRQRARGAFFPAWSRSRGLRGGAVGDLPVVPLLEYGDQRWFRMAWRGRIGTHGEGLFGLYTCTDITTSSEGKEQRRDYNYTIVAFELPQAVAERYHTVHCLPDSLRRGPLKWQSKGLVRLGTESIEFDECYGIYAGKAQSKYEVLDLFEPDAMVDLLDFNLAAAWQQHGRWLVVVAPDHPADAPTLDAIAEFAACVHNIYVEEAGAAGAAA